MSERTITNIEDLERAYARRVPRVFQEYVTSGAWTESTLKRNLSDFEDLQFRQRVGVDISNRSTEATILGEKATIPLALSPVGLLGMQHGDGEILAAQAAEEFGVPFTLSTMSICSLEDVARNTSKPFWFQLYVMRDLDFMRDLMQRARDAGVSTLVVTLDLQVQGQRNRDLKNGMSVPPALSAATILDMATRWRWGLNMLKTKRRSFGNLVGHVKGLDDMSLLVEWVNKNFDQALDWNKLSRIRDEWDGKLVLKGILDPADASRAVEVGADAIIVSNHGGRQMDGAPSTISMLPAITDSVQGAAEVLLDSGVRSGQDVLRARALGADAAMIGRAFTFGLGAKGKTGVTEALSLIKNELELTMAFTGTVKNQGIGPHVLLSYPPNTVPVN